MGTAHYGFARQLRDQTGASGCGPRPARYSPACTVVGMGFGADGVNAAVEPFRSGLTSNLGFDLLATLKVSDGRAGGRHAPAGSPRAR